MAGGQERILRGRIRSVQATKKITRAMELIAASRIVKAQQRVQAAVPYSELITNVVKDLAAAGAGSDSPFLKPRADLKRTCYVAIVADRGLCGGYNAGVLRATEGEVKVDVLKGRDYAIVPVGRKAESYFRFRGYSMKRGFAGFSDAPKYDSAKEIGMYVTDLFLAGEVDRVDRSCRSRPKSSRVVTLAPPAAAASMNSNPTLTQSSARCSRATSKPACTRRCSMRPPASTPSVNGR